VTDHRDPYDELCRRIVDGNVDIEVLRARLARYQPDGVRRAPYTEPGNYQ
jgi:hypothetical protein